MNFINLIFATFAASILCSIFSRADLAFGELVDHQKINSDKSSKVLQNHNIVYFRDITHILIGGRIITQFKPQNEQGIKLELNQLASNLGYDHFNWVNYVEQDPHGILNRAGQKMFTPYNDPPIGGYQYDRADKFPFYWDIVNCDRCNQRHHFQNHNNLQQFSLIFEDAPADYRLQPEEAVEFMTSLVGVKNINFEQNKANWDVLHTFRWKLSNPRPNYSQVSLIDTNVDLNQLSPILVNTMLSDGGEVINKIEVSNIN